MERNKKDKPIQPSGDQHPDNLAQLNLPPDFGKFVKAFMQKKGHILKRLADFDQGHE